MLSILYPLALCCYTQRNPALHSLYPFTLLPSASVVLGRNTGISVFLVFSDHFIICFRRSQKSRSDCGNTICLWYGLLVSLGSNKCRQENFFQSLLQYKKTSDSVATIVALARIFLANFVSCYHGV